MSILTRKPREPCSGYRMAPGTLAQARANYEASVRKTPTYHTGEPRKTWDELMALYQWVWRTNTANKEQDK